MGINAEYMGTSNYKFVEKFKLLSPISTKMPAGPDETDNHAPGAATEHTAKHASFKTESNASTHPLHDQGEPKGDKVEFIHAQPGPAVPESPKYDCWWAYSVWEHGVGQSGNL